MGMYGESQSQGHGVSRELWMHGKKISTKSAQTWVLLSEPGTQAGSSGNRILYVQELSPGNYPESAANLLESIKFPLNNYP